MAPPVVRIPPAVSGSPNSCANHLVSASSISVAPGELRHDPAFWFIAAAARSATAPGIVPAAVMYAENRGWFGYAE